jgi:EmrB/QacA subfamily drug resistance transporter
MTPVDTRAPTTAAAATATYQGWVLGLTATASLMVMLDVMVVVTALHTIRVQLQASIDQLEWTISAYTLSFAVFLMTAAALGNRFGWRRLFVAGLAVFTGASAACALAPDMSWLIAARTVQGAGSAMIMPHALALLTAAFPPERRARALGLFSSVAGLATLAGPFVGGAVVQNLTWHWIFWLNVPIGFALIVLVLWRIDAARPIGGSLDFGGLLLAMGASLGLVWGLVRANAIGWSSPEVVTALAGGVAMLVAFVAWELHVEKPMLPMQHFRSRAFSAGNASSFLMYGSIVAAAFLIAQYLQTALGYAPMEAGLRMLPWTVTLFVVAPIAGALVNRVGERALMVGGLTLQTLGFVCLALLARFGQGYLPMVLPLIVAGCGVSMAMPAAQNAVLGALPRTALGAASGTFNTLRQLGGTFGVAIVAAVFAALGSYASPQAFVDGFTPALGVAAALSGCAAALGILVPGRRLEAAEQPTVRARPVLQETTVAGA